VGFVDGHRRPKGAEKKFFGGPSRPGRGRDFVFFWRNVLEKGDFIFPIKNVIIFSFMIMDDLFQEK